MNQEKSVFEINNNVFASALNIDYRFSCDQLIELLRALGWTPQKLAIEWQKVDAALFGRLPRSSENLLAVVEAKRKGFKYFSHKLYAV